MSNSYILKLEDLRQDLRDRLRQVGFVIENDDVPLDVLVNKVNSIGYADEDTTVNNYNIVKALAGNLTYALNDSENLIQGVSSTFFKGTKVTSLNLPACTSISVNQAFSGCNQLTDVDIRNCKTLANQVFYNCANLENVRIDSLGADGGIMGTGVFAYCPKLKSVDLPATVAGIPATTFDTSTGFDTLILRYTGGVVSIGNISAFANTPFRNGTGGTVYVPDDLKASYERSSSWGTNTNLPNLTIAKLSDLV